MIIEEIWNAIIGLIICITYPLIIVIGIVFTFLDTVYQAIHSSIAVVLLLVDCIIELFEIGFSMIIPAPYIVGYTILFFIMIVNFLKRRLGEIEIAGFRFGG